MEQVERPREGLLPALESVRKAQGWDQVQLEGWVAILHSPQAQEALLSELISRESRLVQDITRAKGAEDLFRLQGELKSTREISKVFVRNIDILKGVYNDTK